MGNNEGGKVEANLYVGNLHRCSNTLSIYGDLCKGDRPSSIDEAEMYRSVVSFGHVTLSCHLLIFEGYQETSMDGETP